MKTRLFLTAAGAMLLLASCMPDLPAPRMTVNLDTQPAETSTTPFDWTIEGRNHLGERRTYEGDCLGRCDSVLIFKGDWTLRVSPPDPTSVPEAQRWVGTGTVPAPADGEEQEITADYIQDFRATVSEGELDLTATFRRPHTMEVTIDRPAEGDTTVTLSGVVRGADSPDFTLAGITATTCLQTGSPVPYEYEADGTYEISTTPQTITMEHSGGGTPPPLSDGVLNCTFEAFDSDFRPVMVNP